MDRRMASELFPSTNKFAHRSSAEDFVGTIEVIDGQIGFDAVRSQEVCR
jgi:hypothetical protein